MRPARPSKSARRLSSGSASRRPLLLGRFPLDVPQAPFCAKTRFGLAANNDLCTAARTIGRCEKNALLDLHLRCGGVEQPAFTIRENAHNGAAVAHPLQTHIGMNVKPDRKRNGPGGSS